MAKATSEMLVRPQKAPKDEEVGRRSGDDVAEQGPVDAKALGALALVAFVALVGGAFLLEVLSALFPPDLWEGYMVCGLSLKMSLIVLLDADLEWLRKALAQLCRPLRRRTRPGFQCLGGLLPCRGNAEEAATGAAAAAAAAEAGAAASWRRHLHPQREDGRGRLEQGGCEAAHLGRVLGGVPHAGAHEVCGDRQRRDSGGGRRVLQHAALHDAQGRAADLLCVVGHGRQRTAQLRAASAARQRPVNRDGGEAGRRGEKAAHPALSRADGAPAGEGNP
mmetsp:Transcript_4070/g.15714  ORF Transcript_4070/g.15714 Transcript_4070/m.15714 type:complete len:278 (+) Transcript_4070:2087-2920(+)